MGQCFSSEQGCQAAGKKEVGPGSKRALDVKGYDCLATVTGPSEANSPQELSLKPSAAAPAGSNAAATATDDVSKSIEHCESASSTHAAAFVQWARKQSASRRMSLDEFIVQQCKAGNDTSVLQLDTMGLAEVLAAAAETDGAAEVASKHQQWQQHMEPFQPHNGHLSGAPKPACHQERIAAADGINALRATRDGEIEAMLRLLCRVFDVETATVALLTGEAIYITGACGALPVCVCPDRWGFCGWSFINSHHELLVVEDMDADARFAENFFVIDPTFSLKFYVAAPLVSSNGHRLGTLCIMGQQPRKFDVLRGQMLANLAEMLVRQLEVKWAEAMQASADAACLRRSLTCYAASYLVLDLSASPWRIVHMNEPARNVTGVDWTASYSELADYAAGRRYKQPFDGMPINALFNLAGATIVWGSSSSSSSGAWEFRLSGLTPAPDAPAALYQGLAAAAAAAAVHSASSGGSGVHSPPTYSLRCRLAISDGLDEQQPFYIGVPSWLALSEDNTWGRNYFFALLEIEGPGGVAAAAAAATPMPATCCQQQQQRQQMRAQLPFEGDSVEQLMKVTTEMLAGNNAASAAAAGSSGDGGCSSSSSSNGLCWLPRDLAAAADGSSCASISSSVASSSQPSLPLSLGSSGSVTGSLKSVATSVTSSNSTGGVVCRGLPVPGLVLGPLVGRGSYGKVYRGLLKGQPVAVKIIDDISSLRLAKSGEPLEISLTRNLKQTGIMTSLTYTYSDAAAVPTTTTAAAAAGRPGGRASSVAGSAGRPSRGAGRRVCWMVFEYCDKGVLADGVLRGWFRTCPNPLKGAPQLRTIGLTALEVAVAMDHLHSNGIMHGDLCGGNVMLSKSSINPHGFTAKVGDFGLARINTTSSSSSANGHPVDQRLQNNAYGTITHMSPEVLLDGGSAFTPAADVYSWGVLLWEMLTGSRAWAGMAAPAVVCQVAVLKRGLAIPEHLPPILEDLLKRALSPEPAKRPGFREIVEVLTRFVQESRAVDWEAWQAAVDAAHAAEVAAASEGEFDITDKKSCPACSTAGA